METQNKNSQKKYVKEERKRLIKLVETAYNNDPRIRKMREEEAEAKRIAK